MNLSAVRRLLFVCSANEFRSPVAEVIFNELARRSHVEVTATSAGCSAWPDGPAAAAAVEMVGRLGYNLRSHQTRRVTRRTLEGVDMVLCMTRRHVETVHELVPDDHRPVLTFKSVCLNRAEADLGEAADVADPVGGDRKILLACVGEIHELTEQLVRAILVGQQTC